MRCFYLSLYNIYLNYFSFYINTSIIPLTIFLLELSCCFFFIVFFCFLLVDKFTIKFMQLFLLTFFHSYMVMPIILLYLLFKFLVCIRLLNICNLFKKNICTYNFYCARWGHLRSQHWERSLGTKASPTANTHTTC